MSALNDVPIRIKSDLQTFKSLLSDNSKNEQPTSALKKKQAIAEKFYGNLKTKTNVYLYVLDLLYYSSDVMKSHSTVFNKNILTLFQEWLNTNKVKEPIDLEWKKLAVRMFLQIKLHSATEIACQVFDLSQDKEILKEIIDDYLGKGHLMEAYPIIMALDLQPYYALEKVVLPLIFKCRRIEVEEFLKNYPDLQLQLVKLLDEVSSNRSRFSLFLAKFDFSTTKGCDIYMVQKMLGKFLNTFKIPLEACPNLMQKRQYGALLYVIRKRFLSNEMTDESFEEVALNAVKNNPSLQNELLVQLATFNEMEMALKFAHTLNLKRNNWPSCLLSYEENKTSNFTPAKEETWDTWNDDSNEITEKFLTLRLDEKSVYIVDTLEKLNECIAVIQDYDVVGFDAEWRPTFGVKDDSKLALLQLAVWDYVYLIDVISLSPKLKPSDWGSFYEKIFANSKILKLGFSVIVDINMIKEFCAGDKKNLELDSVLDLDLFVKRLLVMYPDINDQFCKLEEPSISNYNADKGLSKLCRTVLGTPLNKADQFSDWQKRPLRQSQIIYASLDAYCLLMIYERLSKCLCNLNLNIDDVIKEYSKPSTVPSAIKKKGLSKIQKQQLLQVVKDNRKYNYVRDPIPISQFKVVVDNMLSGLGKELRICGADVVILENGANHSEAVKIALAQDCCFLTSGKVFVELCGYLPPGKCFCVEVTSLDQQLTSVFDYFNIRCTEDDVFTRCTLCNCNCYLKISSHDLKCLWLLNKNTALYPCENEVLVPFIYCNGGFVTDKGIMHTRIPIGMSGLSDDILSNNSEFCVCSGCGKVYWEGSHHRRKKATIQTLLNSIS